MKTLAKLKNSLHDITKPVRNMVRKTIMSCINHYALIFLVIPIVFFGLAMSGFNISSNAYYYTLSTISQTLGAILGIIGAFTIFHMSKLDSDRNTWLLNLAEKLRDYCEPHLNKFGVEKPAKRLRIMADEIAIYSYEDEFFDDILSDIWEIRNYSVKTATQKLKEEEHEPAIRNIIGEIEYIEDTKKEMHSLLGFPLTIGVIAILLSILALSLGQIEFPSQVSESIYLLSSPNFYNSLQVAKTILYGIIIYFAIVSIMGAMLYMDKLFGVHYK